MNKNNKATRIKPDYNHQLLINCFKKYDSFVWSEKLEPSSTDNKNIIWWDQYIAGGFKKTSLNWGIKEIHEYKNDKVTFKVENEKAEVFYLHFANRKPINKGVQA